MKYSKKEWERINQILRERDVCPSQFKHISCVRRSPTETADHFLMKAEICNDLYNQKIPFLTEVWNRKHDKRMDILNLKTGENSEVETGKSLNKKYKGDKVVMV